MDEFISALQQNKMSIEGEYSSSSNRTISSIAKRFSYTFLGMNLLRTLGVHELYSVLIGREVPYNPTSELLLSTLDGYERTRVGIPFDGRMISAILVAKHYESDGSVAVERSRPREIIFVSASGRSTPGSLVPYDGKLLISVSRHNGMTIMERYLDTSPAHLEMISRIEQQIGMEPRLAEHPNEIEDAERRRFENLIGDLNIDV